MDVRVTMTQLLAGFILPWPPVKLSPNARAHWRTKAAAAKAYKTACWGAVREQSQRAIKPALSGHLAVELEFRPPDRRSYDRDNLLARVKSGLDGLCEALGINDAQFSALTITVGAPFNESCCEKGAVLVRIGAMVPA